MSKSLRIILYAAASLVGLAVVVVGLFVISRLAHSGDVLSGIAVGSADLSGLNDTEARDALLTLEQDMASVPLMVRVQDTVFDLDPSTIGFDLAGLCGCNENAYVRPQWWGVNVRYNF